MYGLPYFLSWLVLYLREGTCNLSRSRVLNYIDTLQYLQKVGQIYHFLVTDLHVIMFIPPVKFVSATRLLFHIAPEFSQNKGEKTTVIFLSFLLRSVYQL